MWFTMIGYGLLAGFSFVLALTWVRLWAVATAPTAPAGEADISEQVWQVLAEARKITEGRA